MSPKQRAAKASPTAAALADMQRRIREQAAEMRQAVADAGPPGTVTELLFRLDGLATPSPRTIEVKFGKDGAADYWRARYEEAREEARALQLRGWPIPYPNEDPIDSLDRFRDWLRTKVTAAPPTATKPPATGPPPAVRGLATITDGFQAEHFWNLYDIKAPRLRKAQKEGRLVGEKRGGRWYYSEASARSLWPDEVNDGKS